MSFTVTMPQLGETVTEGTILSWAKQPGDAVAEDDVLLEISTDKVDTEVPSPFAGTLLEILVPEGETVDVGTALAVIGEPGEQAAAPPAQEAATAPPAEELPSPPAPPPADEIPSSPAPPAEESPPPAAPVSPPPAPVPADVPATGAATGVLSPVVRRLAAEHGVDLALVAGTGRDGRITRRDVEAHIAAAGAAPLPAEPPAKKAGLGRGLDDLLGAGVGPPAGIVGPPPVAEEPVAEEPVGEEPVGEEPVSPPPAPVPADAPAVAAPAEESVPAEIVVQAPLPDFEGTEEPLSRLRSVIATNMIKAKQTAAHVWTSMEIDFEHVERVRRRHKAVFREREGFSLTYLPFITRAAIDALAAYPVVNSSLDLEAGTRTLHGQVHLGVGVDLDQDGLVVMTVRGADGLRMRGIAREVRRLADKARGGSMEPDDLAGSTFTITNPGPFGSFMSAPIINVPNVAILSTDAIKKRAIVISDEDGNDAIAIHHVGYLGLTWDHRAFDGSTAVMFLQRIRENLESWDWEQELA